MKKCIVKNKSLVFIIAIAVLLIYFTFGKRIISKLGMNDFSINFWIKIDSQRLGEKYLTISDGSQELSLVAHLQDENGMDKGLVLSHDNGEIYGGIDFLPEYNTFSNIVINYKKNKFELYLNGAKIGDNIFSKYFSRSNLLIDFIVDDSHIIDYSFEKRSLNEDEIDEEYQEKLILTMDNIDYSDSFKKSAYGKVPLPLTKKEIKYSSNNEDLLKIDDKYLYFNNNLNEDKEVVLVCEYQNVKKEILFNVRGSSYLSRIDNVERRIKNMLSNTISESDIIPSIIEGFNIVYTPNDEQIKYVNGKFIDSLDREKSEINITVNINNVKEFNIKTTLLDEYYGYLVVYFSGQAFWPEYVKGEEKIHFAVSRDLKTFNKLDDFTVDSNEGSNRFRDPFIMRTNDQYIVFSTQAYYYPDIYISKTNDFSSFKTGLKNITNYSFDIGLHGNYSWSPECFFDNTNNEYVIYYSDPESENSSIFAVTTKDFEEFSSPFVFFNAGYKIIDANICEINGNIYLFYKDERDINRICYASTDYLTKDCTWTLHDDIYYFKALTDCEGPFVIKNYDNNKYYLYCDSYGTIYSTPLVINDENITGKLTKDPYINQIDEIRHFSILPITKSEYSSLIERQF